MTKLIKKEIKTPLRYPGGKSRVADMIVEKIPHFEEYREPFIGGGSVFIKLKQKFPHSKYWINDLFYDLYCFWNEIQNNKNDLLNIIYKWKETYNDGKELYNYLRNNLFNFSITERACAFFILNRITFSGTSYSGGYSQQAFDKRFTKSCIDRIEMVAELLNDVIITNLDYESVVRQDGKNVFIYMDPPYYTATKSALYGKNGELHTGFDHERFSDIVKNCSHQWLITYDDCEYIRDLYKGFTIIPFELKYGMKNINKNGEMTGKEIMISNYL